MGPRRKLLYRQGALRDARTGQVVRAWEVDSEAIVPDRYRVALETAQGAVEIAEDERGIWIDQGGRRAPLSQSRVALPDFAGHPHADMLRTLHHEILINLIDGLPVPNFIVYPRPWYRDAAMMCMCLEKTGNLGLVREWVLGLREPFDRNNAGRTEPDNLGQALYMISLVSDASHPLVERILVVRQQFRRGDHIVGVTDGREHPVYQTKWLKFGLTALGLDDDLTIPLLEDTYSSLFWMDYQDRHVEGPRFGDRSATHYPYLAWAEDHFYGEPPRFADSDDVYPNTWETESSEADFDRMAVISEDFVRRRTCMPHAWHAAEMFLYLIDRG